MSGFAPQMQRDPTPLDWCDSKLAGCGINCVQTKEANRIRSHLNIGEEDESFFTISLFSVLGGDLLIGFQSRSLCSLFCDGEIDVLTGNLIRSVIAQISGSVTPLWLCPP
jgi:hypothetical protein